MAKLKAELGTTKATLEKSQQQERLAKKQIMTIYNPGRLPVPKWRKEREDAAAKLKELEAALAKVGADMAPAVAYQKSPTEWQRGTLWGQIRGRRYAPDVCSIGNNLQ